MEKKNRWLFPMLYALADVLFFSGILGTIFFLNPYYLVVSLIGLWKKDLYDRLRNEEECKG